MGNVKCQKLLDYISYFEQENFKFYTWHQSSDTNDGVIDLGYPIYEEKIDRFIKDVYDSDLLMSDYLNYLEKHQIDPSNMKVNIAEADFQLLRAILTHCVRGERFCDGFWVQVI